MSNTDLRASLTVTADANSVVAEMRRGSEGLREMRREAEAMAKAAAFAVSEQGRMADRMARAFDGFGSARKSARDSASVFSADQDYRAFDQEQKDRAARAYKALEESLNPVIRAERELAAAQDVVNRALEQGQISQAAAARSLEQLQTKFDRFVLASNPAAQSARAMEAAIEAEAAAIRDMTLALDPAARASAEMEQAQGRLQRAVALGIVTQEEASRVLGLLAARQRSVGAGGVTMGMGIQNASFQIADFAVQVQAGQAASLALAQQLPQLLGGFGIIGAVMGAAVAIGAPLVTMWLNNGEAALTLDEQLQKLETTLASVSDHLETLDDQNLSETFGSMTADIRSMTTALLELERVAELRNLQKSLDALLKEKVTPSFMDEAWEVLTASRGAPARSTEELTKEKFSELTGGRGPGFDEFQTRRNDITSLAKAGEVERVMSELNRLISDFTDGVAFTELNADLIDLLLKLGAVAKQTAEVEAHFNGTARASAITREIDTMVRGYDQQAELSRAIVKHGEDSAEVDAVRARHARAMLDLRLREMKVAEDSEDAARAIAALEADLAATASLRAQERQRAEDALFSDLQRQSELSGAILTFGKESAEVEAVRARQAREVNAERLKEMNLGPGLTALAEALFAAEQKRTKAIKDRDAARKADLMVTGLREEAAINRAILQYGRDSVQVKELQIAAERRAYEESLRTLDVSEQRKRELMAEWEAAKGLAAADPFGSQAAANDMLRDQRERLAQLRLEHALLGQTEAVRGRILALWKAEADIRRQHIDATGARAAEIRAAALEEFELQRSLDQQAAAWGKVQSSAESAIDGIVDKLMGGDIEGALEALAKDIGGMFTELAITNPLKNAILGTDYGTIQDVGGLQGIWARLSGKAPQIDGAALIKDATAAASMTVTTPMVNISTSGIAGLGGLGPAANSPGAPGGIGAGLSGSADVQSQVWNFFRGKGLQPHQVAAIMGNAQAESGFNPFAVGDGGTSFGLFQHHAARGRGLLGAVGGKAGLGDIGAQLEYVWQELLTSESGVLKRLMTSTNVKDATSAFVGFERPQGWSAADPTGSHNWAGRLAAAESALAKFGTTATDATAGLGTLGNGFGVFGNALAQGLQGLASGGAKGGLGGLLGALGTGIASALGIPGFAAGGDHLGGLRIVGERGPELEFTGPSRIFDADLTRSLLTSRPPQGANAPAPVIQMQPVLVNNTSREVDLKVEETTDARGQRQQRWVISEAVGDGLATPGGKAQRNMKQVYGLGRAARRRS